MKIITISGHAQNGKDSTGIILKKLLEDEGHSVLVTHFGDLLKYICKTFFGWDGEKDEVGRQILQYIGTDMIRAKRPDFWVEFLVDILGMFRGHWNYVIIPDCRFPNEIDCFVDHAFDVTHLRVVRENFTSPLTQQQQQHPSETALDNVVPDIYIRNNGTLEDLEQTVKQWRESYDRSTMA